MRVVIAIVTATVLACFLYSTQATSYISAEVQWQWYQHVNGTSKHYLVSYYIYKPPYGTQVMSLCVPDNGTVGGPCPSYFPDAIYVKPPWSP